MPDNYGRGVCIAISSVAIIIRLAFNSVHVSTDITLADDKLSDIETSTDKSVL